MKVGSREERTEGWIGLRTSWRPGIAAVFEERLRYGEALEKILNGLTKRDTKEGKERKERKSAYQWSGRTVTIASNGKFT
jgi:hypothetical protein